jgi:hypothetical protein
MHACGCWTQRDGTVLERPVPNSSSQQAMRMDVSALAPGSYVLQALWNGGRVEHRFNIVR